MQTTGPRSIVAAFFVALIGVSVTALELGAQCDPAWQAGGSIAGVVGAVHVMHEWDPDGAGPAAPVLVVGGAITAAGSAPASGIAQWDPVTRLWSPLGAGVAGEVFALLTMPNGDLVVGGSLTAAGGVPVSAVARWNGTAWSAIGSGLDGDVEALAVLPNGDLVIGGDFENGNGIALNGVARWNGSAWAAMGPGFSAGVTEFAVLQSGELVAAWGPYLGNTWCYLSRWNGVGWDWFGTARSYARINALEVLPNGDLIVAGVFSSMNTVPAPGVARWNGAVWSAVGGNPGRVADLAVRPNGNLLVGTDFSNGNGGVLEFDGTSWNQLASYSGIATQYGGVSSLALLSSGELVAGGQFAGRTMARWGGASWDSLGDGPDRPIERLLMLANGDAIAIPEAATSLLRWDGAGWSTIQVDTDGPILAVAELPGGDLVIGGRFTVAGGVSVQNLARFDGSTWQPLGAGLDDQVNALAILPNGDLVAGGSFLNSGAQSVPFVGVWNGQWSPLGSFPTYASPVSFLAVGDNGELYAARDTVGGGPPLLAWDGSGWQYLSGFLGEVSAMVALRDGRLAVARRSHTSSVHIWNGATFNGVIGAQGTVHAITQLPDGSLVLGGEFVAAGNTLPSYLGRSSATGWQAFGGGPGAAVRALAFAPDGELLVGGELQTPDGILSPHFARIVTPCPATVDELPNNCSGAQGPLELTALTSAWAGATLRTRASGFAAGALGVGLVGLTAPNVPLTVLWPNVPAGCQQLASTDVVFLAFPQNGASTFAISIPAGPTFVGLPLHQQFLAFEFGATTTLIGSNGLRAVVGSY